MFKLVIPDWEGFDERSQTFVKAEGRTMMLEHSLLSLSKWESKWKKPFLDPKRAHTPEEDLDYIRCMTVGNVPDRIVYYTIPPHLIEQVNRYIEDPMTATKINRPQKPGKSKFVKEVPTSELIYFWMISYGIPFECQKWHLNRLMTLIDVCAYKNEKPKKMSKQDLMKRNAALNASRRAQHHTHG